MTETLYLFFIALIIYLFSRALYGRNYWLTAGLAAATAVGFLSRPTLLLFVPVIGLMYLWRRRVGEAAVFGLLFVALLVPWSWRNWQVYGQFIPTTLIGEYNLWVGNTLQSDGGQLGGGFNPWDNYVATNDFFTIRPAAQSAFRSFIVEHPAAFIKLTAIRAVRYFSLIRPMGFWFYQSGLPQLVFVGFSAAGIAVLFIFGFAGLFKLWASRQPLARYLVALALTAPIPLLITVVQSRYRFQIYPFLALFAGYFLAKTGQAWWRDRQLWYVAAVFLLVGGADVALSGGVIVERLGQWF